MTPKKNLRRPRGVSRSTVRLIDRLAAKDAGLPGGIARRHYGHNRRDIH